MNGTAGNPIEYLLDGKVEILPVEDLDLDRVNLNHIVLGKEVEPQFFY